MIVQSCKVHQILKKPQKKQNTTDEFIKHKTALLQKHTAWTITAQNLFFCVNFTLNLRFQGF